MAYYRSLSSASFPFHNLLPLLYLPELVRETCHKHLSVLGLLSPQGQGPVLRSLLLVEACLVIERAVSFNLSCKNNIN